MGDATARRPTTRVPIWHHSTHTGLFHAWEAIDSSLLNVLMPDGFPIAPQWISPILTAGLTATECLSASESAENVSVRLLRWNVVSLPGIRCRVRG